MASKDQVIGALLLIASIIGILVYGWLVFLTPYSLIVVQITAFIAIAAILAILAWIGYTLATTPPPKPIEEIEKELEKELQSVEKTGQEISQQATQESSQSQT